MSYSHQTIEKKWQDYWDANKTFRTTEDKDKPKFYALDMFPYPSGAGLHVGHPKGYTATDVVARMKRAQGYNVLHPMGWDAFGLPAEQYALDTGNDPAEFTAHNIQTFKRQIKSLGFSYDWDREINTTDPDYYKWTQWIFAKMYEKGLAYVDEIPVNWCPALGTVLANEEVINGKSERGGHPVERKPMKQWILKITDYAERLLEDLEELDWPESLKEMQRNWIGKSEGAEIHFQVDGHEETFTVFTTRADTLFGATYAVLAPEHVLVGKITTEAQRSDVEAYIQSVGAKSDLERTELAKEKTGVFTGTYAINPANSARIPIWIGDYVLASYGTGAVMAVPGHDERDHEFASKYDLPIVAVVEGGDVTQAAFVEDGKHMNSAFLDGLYQEEATTKMIEWLEATNAGQRKVTYRLRDWLFSRQRYWGEPIPIIYWEDGTTTVVPVEELPLELPKTDNIHPSGTGESPLANLDDWVNVVDPVTGKKGRRETNTMPQWGGSCWHYLRYIDPHNDKALADMEKLKQWLPVDLYIGGAEHAVLHLLYARFWHKFLYDIGVVPTKEPFQKLFNQGMILGTSYKDSRGSLVAHNLVEEKEGKFFHIETGEELEETPAKMSKSLKNVINPDDIIASHGADTLRLYEMFMGPLDAGVAWSTQGLDGARRFLDRVWRLYIAGEGQISMHITDKDATGHLLEKVYHQTVKKVTDDFAGLHFNTAISQMMIFINECYKVGELPRTFATGFLQLLAPIVPHIAEELWERLGFTESISYAPFPTYDESKLVESEVEIVVQVNGKVRSKINVAKDASKDEVEKIALAQEAIQNAMSGKTVRKVIVVPGKLVNVVIG